MFFDENFNPVSQGARRVGQQNDDQITESEIKVPANGYAFIYLSNSSNIPVYFDEFWVTHKRGRILQENHYYSYGLQIASISSKAAGKIDNMYRYQGAYSEFEEETGWNDFELRTYDAQIGRWTGVDPYDQFASGYVGMGNNPVNGVDPNGGFFGYSSQWIGTAIGAVAGGTAGYFIDKNNGGNGWGGMAAGLVGGAGIGYGVGSIDWEQVGSFFNRGNVYNNAPDNIYKQVAPKILHNVGGIKGIEVSAIFTVIGVEADGLQIIQTFQGTRRKDNLQMGAMILKDKNTNYDAFVDGGKNSPYVTINGQLPAHPSKPYYLTPSEAASQISFDKSKGTGSIWMYDRPSSVANHKIAKFETAIIARNYKGTGKDFVLGAFSYGWRNYGRTPLHSGNGINLGKTISATARKIIQHDYPSYKMF